MNTKLILLSIAGIAVVLFLINKLKPGESQVISQIVPVGSINAGTGADSRIAFEANKTSAFQSLLGLGQTQQSAEIASKSFDNAVSLENIRASASLNLASKGSERDIMLAGIERDRDVTIGLAGFNRDLGLADVASKTQLQLTAYQTEAQRQQQRDYLDSVLQQLQIQTSADERRVQAQTAALNSAAITFRNQSLERQGTILNSLTTLFTGQAPYTYQSAFGGSRPPTFLQQLTGGQGVGGLITSVGKLFGL